MTRGQTLILFTRLSSSIYKYNKIPILRNMETHVSRPRSQIYSDQGFKGFRVKSILKISKLSPETLGEVICRRIEIQQINRDMIQCKFRLIYFLLLHVIYVCILILHINVEIYVYKCILNCYTKVITSY